jgi:hypothetical protein
MQRGYVESVAHTHYSERKNMLDSKLGFGPMSPEIIEGVIKASSLLTQPLMLISTQNQIDWNGGYVNNWKTSEYAEYVRTLLPNYPESRIYLCRDHLGPGFKSNNLDDVYKTLYDDIDNGFDLIHIDFSNMHGDKDTVLDETKKVITDIQKRTDAVRLEIGTEENVGKSESTLSEIEREIEFVKDYADPDFFVVQTGSLVKEINQVGSFHREFIVEAHSLLSSYGIGLKEHNADYLDQGMIGERIGIVDAMNIAPQLGVIQTVTLIEQALIFGVDTTEFLEVSYNSKRWEKWLYENTAANSMLCAVIAGHYNFMTEAYQRLVFRLEKQIDIRKMIVDKTVETIQFYSRAFG